MGIRFSFLERWNALRGHKQPTCKAVKTEYSAFLGSPVTLRCEIENVSIGVWVCPDTRREIGTITDTHYSLEIECVDENSEGEYICTAPRCQSESIKLSIRKPTELFRRENKTVELKAPEQQGKEYKWTYLSKNLPERDITGRKYTVGGCKLTIKGYLKEDEGIYICRDKETDEQLDAFCLKTKYVTVKDIRKPRNIEVIQTFDRTLEHKTPEQGKEYEWTYLREDLPERDIITGMKYTLDGCKLTIRGYLKRDEGIYICRDKETDEQLDAFCLKTKYVEVKVDLTFMEKPANEDFRKKLISSTEQLLRKDQELMFKVSITTSEASKIKTETESSSCVVMNAVAYIIKERNSTEYEQMRQRYDPSTTVFMLFLSGNRRLPDLDFDRKYIAMEFEQNANDVKCKFYENYKAEWENLLQQLTDGAETSGITDNVN